MVYGPARRMPLRIRGHGPERRRFSEQWRTIVQFDNVGCAMERGRRRFGLSFSLRHGGFYFSPDRRRRQDLAPEIALPRPAPEPRPDQIVRRGYRHHAEEAPARLPSADRGRLPGFPLVTHLSAFDNVALPLGRRSGREGFAGPGERDAGLVGLGHRASARPPLCRAASSSGSPSPGRHRPAGLLVADEPTGNVDLKWPSGSSICSIR